MSYEDQWGAVMGRMLDSSYHVATQPDSRLYICKNCGDEIAVVSMSDGRVASQPDGWLCEQCESGAETPEEPLK